MNIRSKWKHWLYTGLALVSSAAHVQGQTGLPYQPGAYNGGAPGMGMPVGYPGSMPGQGVYGMGAAGPASYAVPGPPPGEVQYMDDPRAAGPSVVPAGFAKPGGANCDCCQGACDVSAAYGGGLHGSCNGACGDGSGLCTDCGGTGCLFCSGAGCAYCGGSRGCNVCGSFGGRLGLAPIRNILRSSGLGAEHVNTDGCMSCGWGNNALLPGRFVGLLGKLAPYSDGAASQRWFDVHIGTIALTRTDNNQANTVISRQPAAGAAVLRLSDPSLDEIKFGLLATVALQTGPGSNLELTYFGLNKWDSSVSAVSPVNADLFSIFSNFGVNPPGGYDDTDNSIRHTVSYKSAIHNAELSFRRRMVAPQRYIQGSWLAGVRYFDLDEKFGFEAVGLTNNGLNQTLRFFNLDTQTRNELVGFQVGGDTWLTIVPGLMVGVEGKTGVYGNHSEVDSVVAANSIARARERLASGDTSYLNQLQLMGVYRLTYSWAFRASYNYMQVKNVALASRNFNLNGLTPDVNGLVFGANRNPFIDVNGDAKYSGFTLGAEYLW